MNAFCIEKENPVCRNPDILFLCRMNLQEQPHPKWQKWYTWTRVKGESGVDFEQKLSLTPKPSISKYGKIKCLDKNGAANQIINETYFLVEGRNYGRGSCLGEFWTKHSFRAPRGGGK